MSGSESEEIFSIIFRSPCWVQNVCVKEKTVSRPKASNFWRAMTPSLFFFYFKLRRLIFLDSWFKRWGVGQKSHKKIALVLASIVLFSFNLLTGAESFWKIYIGHDNGWKKNSQVQITGRLANSDPLMGKKQKQRRMNKMTELEIVKILFYVFLMYYWPRLKNFKWLNPCYI